MAHTIMERLMALGIFSSYFLIIICLFCFLLANLPSSLKRNGSNFSVYIFGALALISFAHTWYCESQISAFSFQFTNYVRHVLLHDGGSSSYWIQCTSLILVQWSFRNFEQLTSTQNVIFFERLTNWLRGTELFEQSWSIVCAGPLNWWWSEQLCLFSVGAWTIFLSAQG